MSGLKTIRRRLSSVKNTKQITRAMKLVSAAKLRRAQEAALGGRAFSERLGGVLSQVLLNLPESSPNPLLEVRAEIKRRCVVVFSGERGLCGAYNSNVAKAVAQGESSSSVPTDYICVGRRALASAHRAGWNVVGEYVGLGEDASAWPMRELGTRLMEEFASGKYDDVVIYYTKFISTMTLLVTRDVLLPFAPQVADASGEVEAPGEVLFDPAPEEILPQLIPLLVKTRLFQAGFESKACEHASRMTAMDSATRNADELMEKLRLFYNRARQRAITTELIDILGGAEAQK